MKGQFLWASLVAFCFVLNSLGQEPVVKEHPHITVNVLGAFKKPSCITLPSDGTIIDALAAAGGATDEANLHWVRLFHKSTNGRPDVIKVNIRDILNEKAANVVLLDGDTIDVPIVMTNVKF